MSIRGKIPYYSKVLFFSGFLLFIVTPGIFAAHSGQIQDQTVQIGQWIIKSGSFEIADDAVWRTSAGTARNKGDSIILISIYKNPQLYKSVGSSERAELSVNIPDIGEALFEAKKIMHLRQAPENPLEVILRHSLVCTYNRQKFVFKRTVEYRRESGALETKNQFVSDCIQKALIGASSDKLVLFAKLFFEEKIELDKYSIAKGYPSIEASIDNDEYIELKRSPGFKGGDYGCNIPAQPGQDVKFRICFDTDEITATTYGLEVNSGYEFSAGNKIAVDDRECTFDSKGIARLDYGDIKNADVLAIKYKGWRRSDRIFRGHIFLRWGRSEEAWLGNNYFPLADKVTNPSLENCIYNLLHDLNVAFDWDRNCWIVSRGEQREKYYPDWDDFAALDGLDLKDFPQLLKIDKGQIRNEWLKSNFDDVLLTTPYKETGKITLNEIKLIQESLIAPSRGVELWKKMISYRNNEPGGWHSPYDVLVLACLWNEFPELREDNPLEQILDFWVEAIKENPDPVRSVHKSFTGIDDNLYSRVYAIAALHKGDEIFDKDEYKKARDIQVKRLREYLQEKGVLDSIINLQSWIEGIDRWHYSKSGRLMCEAVSLYGQVCAFTGDAEGLKQAQEWIKTALLRKGPEEKNPFHNYQEATFKDRCGFIAVLRGEPPYTEMPLGKDSLFNLREKDDRN